ncbi:hypothetical protein F4V43_02160 [Paenibacillus spiritus]|uniref:Uncharacterized protein n=1 Tax=Paenibacillus spiritus TaxID=2496557 RepID=A0A5J5GGM9_9BACL|nr:hypothetical protein [Paenibacillus spiritus]KAA9007311.1 hypothetical protein F4V43_02160 [Paenibacillus spiritus]
MSKEAEWLNIEDVIGVRTESTKKEKDGFLVYITKDGQYYRDCVNVDKTLMLLNQEEGYIKTDKGMIANLNAHPELDEKFKLFKYKIDHELGTKNEFITIAEKRFKDVKLYFERFFKKD